MRIAAAYMTVQQAECPVLLRGAFKSPVYINPPKLVGHCLYCCPCPVPAHVYSVYTNGAMTQVFFILFINRRYHAVNSSCGPLWSLLIMPDSLQESAAICGAYYSGFWPPFLLWLFQFWKFFFYSALHTTVRSMPFVAKWLKTHFCPPKSRYCSCIDLQLQNDVESG